MPEPSPELRTLAGRYGAELSWSRTRDRAARTAPARRAAAARFEKLVDPTDSLDPVLRAELAEKARAAHMAKMAYLSAKARRARATTQPKAGVAPETGDGAERADVPDAGPPDRRRVAPIVAADLPTEGTPTTN